MSLNVHLHVKFRAFGVTLSEYDREWSVPIPIPSLPQVPAGSTLLSVNERGVSLLIKLS